MGVTMKKRPTMHRTTIWLDQSQLKWLEKEAIRRGLKSAQILRLLISDAMRKS
jgi:hypothetical protein